MHLRARYGHGGRVGYEREWRADPARSGGGELIDQGMHLLDLTPLAGRPAAAALGAAAHPLLGHAGRGQRRADPGRGAVAHRSVGDAARRAGRSGRTSSRWRSTAAPRRSRSTGSSAPTGRSGCGSTGCGPSWAHRRSRSSTTPTRTTPGSASGSTSPRRSGPETGALLLRRPARRALRLGADRGGLRGRSLRADARGARAGESPTRARHGRLEGIGLAAVARRWPSGARASPLVARGAEALRSARGGAGRRRTPRRSRWTSRTSDAWAARRAEQLGELDGLVCAAAVLDPIGPIGSYALADFRRTLEVNVLGTLLAIRHVPAGAARQSAARSSRSAAAARPRRCRASTPTRRRRRLSCASPRTSPLELCRRRRARQLRRSGLRRHRACTSARSRPAREARGSRLLRAHAARSSSAAVCRRARPPSSVCLLLEGDPDAPFTGKLISAQWDAWREPSFRRRLADERDLATLRRIDDALFTAIGQRRERMSRAVRQLRAPPSRRSTGRRSSRSCTRRAAARTSSTCGRAARCSRGWAALPDATDRDRPRLLHRLPARGSARRDPRRAPDRRGPRRGRAAQGARERARCGAPAGRRVRAAARGLRAWTRP